jgi:GWxTD domain-containing protein
LRELQETPASARAAAWTEFLQETDPAPETPQHEGLRDYLGRLETANARFREGAVPGWLTDRGMVFSALGEPDRASEPTRGDPTGSSFRMLLWEYDVLRARLYFIDRSGMGEWRLTPASENEFREIVRHRRVQ